MGKTTCKLCWVKSVRVGDASRNCAGDASFFIHCMKPSGGVAKDIILNTEFGSEGLENYLVEVKAEKQKRSKSLMLSLFTKGSHLAHAKRALENTVYNKEIFRSPGAQCNVCVCLKFEFQIGISLRPNVVLHRWELLPQAAQDEHIITALYEDEEKQQCIGIVYGNMCQ